MDVSARAISGVWLPGGGVRDCSSILDTSQGFPKSYTMIPCTPERTEIHNIMAVSIFTGKSIASIEK